MSDSNNEKGSFHYLLEAEVRRPNFMKAAKEIAGSKLTPDIAVNLIFLLIKSVDELNEWLVKVDKQYNSKYTKYLEFNNKAKDILNIFKDLMKFNEDLTLTRESMNLLRDGLKEHFMRLAKINDTKSFVQYRIKYFNLQWVGRYVVDMQ